MAHPRAGPEWQNLVTQLREAPAIPWQQLHHTLQTLQQLARDTGHQLPAAETALVEQLVTAGSREPAGAQIHLTWAMNIFAQTSGYVPATAQEALLQNYLGERQAAHAATVADRWRQPRPAQLTNNHATPPAAEPRPANGRLPELQHPPQPPPSPTDSSTSSTSSTPSTDTTSSSTPIARAPTERPPPQAEQEAARHQPDNHETTNPTRTTRTAAETPAPPGEPERDEQTPAAVVLQQRPQQSTQLRQQQHTRAALASLDDLDLLATLQEKAIFFQSPPQFLKGRIRQILTQSLEEILTAPNAQHSARAWKLWFLLPRMLLQRPPGVRNLPKDEWRERIAHFQEGRWATLLQHVTRPPGTNQPRDDTEDLNRRAHRARHLIHHGELSAARQALTASSLAPGTPSTLAELRDPARRPPQPYQPLDPLIANYHPQEPVTLSTQIFTTSLCRARKGAAPGPSGLTAKTLRLVLDDEEATNKLIQVTQLIARAELPDTASQALGLGRLVALQKPNGRVRGLVIGDLLRRLVARSLAQQFSQHIHQACSPHQYALSTRAGTEAVVHAITSATELDPNNTIVSVDGIGAYDTIARHSMLQALHAVPEAHRCLPFMRLFYAQPSTYVWHDANGNAHRIIQAEGGEQGDPLMPALYKPGNASMPTWTTSTSSSPPHRVETAYQILAHELQQHAHIQLNPAKTRVWNNSGHRPPNVEHLGPEVWVGARELRPEQQGITILGTPVGTPEFQATHLQATADQHSTLLQRIPAIQDLQAEWLLLLYCASPRCNYLLRMLRPEITQPFAQAHDTAITLALAQLLDMRDLAPTALGIAHLPLHLGGLGLTSASRLLGFLG